MESVIVALSSFKASLESGTACDVAARVLPRLFPRALFHFIPIADGGDRTLHVMRWLRPDSRIRYLAVPSAYGNRMKSPFLQLDGSTYFVE